MSKDFHFNLRDKLRLVLWYRKIKKDKHMIEKLKSRKLWVLVLAGALTPILSTLGVPEEIIAKLVGLAMVYIGGESLNDAARNFRTKEG